MNAFLLGTALFLLINIGVGMIRIFRGPSAADRMLTAQLFGTTGIGVLALLSVTTIPAALDVALILALLAVLAAAAFSQRIRGTDRTRERP